MQRCKKEIGNDLQMQLNIKMTVLWDAAPCNLVETDRRFRGAYSFHYQDDLVEHVCAGKQAISFTNRTGVSVTPVCLVMHTTAVVNKIFPRQMTISCCTTWEFRSCPKMFRWLC